MHPLPTPSLPPRRAEKLHKHPHKNSPSWSRLPQLRRSHRGSTSGTRANDHLLPSSYRLLQLIGKGSYGRVFRARDVSSNQLVAVKVIELPPGEQSFGEDVRREVEALSSCVCPFVLKYFGSFLHAERWWLVTELCHAGSLADVMAAMGKPLDAPALAAALCAALAALHYLHGREPMIMHRDVKAANLLLTNRGEVKLADFGVSVSVSQTLQRRSTAIGTPFYMAPEVIQEGTYSGSADLWSLGITAIELAELSCDSLMTASTWPKTSALPLVQDSGQKSTLASTATPSGCSRCR